MIVTETVTASATATAEQQDCNYIMPTSVQVNKMTWHLTVEWWCRRRSVDNRDNGAPKLSAWHGVESVEAAVEILNEL